MWIMTNRGMLSLVQHREKPDTLLARARDRQTLEALLPELEPIELPSADYRYRVEVPKSAMATLASWLVETIDYDNFKNSVQDDALHDAYSQVWTTMVRYQNGNYAPNWNQRGYTGYLWPDEDPVHEQSLNEHDPLEDTQPMLPHWARSD